MALSVGTDPGDTSVPKKHTECTFGKWYYGSGQDIRDLKFFKEIEAIHKELHDKYNEIFKRFEELSSEGFFDDISLRCSDKQNEFNSSIEELKIISKKLLNKLSELENDIEHL